MFNFTLNYRSQQIITVVHTGVTMKQHMPGSVLKHKYKPLMPFNGIKTAKIMVYAASQLILFDNLLVKDL